MRRGSREAAGREWAYQLRQWSAELRADGQTGRARELERLAAVTEEELAELHADHVEYVRRRSAPIRGRTAEDGWCGHGHASLAEALACAGVAPVAAAVEEGSDVA